MSKFPAIETPNGLRRKKNSVIDARKKKIMWSGGVMLGLSRTWSSLQKLIMWERFFCFSPRGIGRICDTTLQKEDRLLTSTVLGISG